MDEVILPMLFVAVLASLAGVVLQFVSWVMHNGLSNRVAKIEAQQQNALTHDKTINIYERLSSLEVLAEAQTATLSTIKRHLLEHE